MTDVRQSPQFANFMKSLNWKVERLNFANVFLKKFPVIGFFAKISRPPENLTFGEISKLFKKYRIFCLKISPNILTINKNYYLTRKKFLEKGFKIERSPFNPTTDIFIDLTQPKENIFNNFQQAKRRGVRKAIKNGIIVKESENYDDFIDIRKKQYTPMGFLLVNEMKKLWENFYPSNASLLLAYRSKKPLAGILLLFYEKIAYYWYASSLPQGKKLFAPTLLVWEALKLSKKKGCKTFHFEGIYDERFPKAAASWKGFTKFKEGFAGEKVVYLENFTN